MFSILLANNYLVNNCLKCVPAKKEVLTVFSCEKNITICIVIVLLSLSKSAVMNIEFSTNCNSNFNDTFPCTRKFSLLWRKYQNEQFPSYN